MTEAQTPPMLDNDVLARVAVLFALIVGFQILVSRVALEREAKRRWQHALTGHILVQASYILPIEYGISGLIIGAIGMAYLRFGHPDKFLEAFGPLLRPEELEAGRLPGAFYFLVGTAMTSLWFDLPTARYAVECLALADPMAAFVGRSVPSPKLHPSASIAGCLACFSTAWLIGFMMLSDATPFHISAGALACTFAEILPLGNDNLTIPLLTATALRWSQKGYSS